MISIEIKQQCLRMKLEGITPRDIYTNYFQKNCGSEMLFESFRKKLNVWKKYVEITEDILEGASLYGTFKPEWGTVQTDGEGKVERTWLRSKKGEDDWKEEILEAIKNIKPDELIIPFNNLVKPSVSLYVVPIFDMHLGVGYYEDFIQTQQDIATEIRLGHEKIIFAIGSDLIHNNDFKGNTANGTPIEQVDMPKAIYDAGKFYIPLLKEAIASGAEVEVIYVKGNHDEIASWGFVHYLSGIFPQVQFDMELEERKARLWNGVFVGFTHGDKASNLRDMAEAFVNENTQIWSQATVKEIYSGHLHKERVAEHLKTRVRILSTRAITDRWSKDRAFHNVKEFQTFVFVPNRRVRMVTV